MSSSRLGGLSGAAWDASRALYGRRLLLADDNDISRQVAFEILERAGASVTTASTGREALECVRAAVSQWQGVTVHEHRHGGVEFRVGRREIGHPHPRFADLPFTRPVRDELVAAGQARPHHVAPDSGWVTVPMRSDVEAAHVIALLRRNYERVPAAPVERAS